VRAPASVAAILAAAAAPVPTPIGAGPRYLLPPGPPAPGARCVGARRRERAHVELFADRRALLLPAGIGLGGRCRFAVSTRAPTGVVEFVPGATLGDLFAVWGQPLAPRRLAGFRGAVRVWVDGRRRRGDPRTVSLRRHAEVVVEVGGAVPPHRFFLFPP
jgi:hypothetical protein